jgi:hypothetical protein
MLPPCLSNRSGASPPGPHWHNEMARNVDRDVLRPGFSHTLHTRDRSGMFCCKTPKPRVPSHALNTRPAPPHGPLVVSTTRCHHRSLTEIHCPCHRHTVNFHVFKTRLAWALLGFAFALALALALVHVFYFVSLLVKVVVIVQPVYSERCKEHTGVCSPVPFFFAQAACQRAKLFDVLICGQLSICWR